MAYSFEQLQNLVLDSNNAKLIYDFAHLIKGADKKRCEKAIVTTAPLDPHYIYCFFRYIKGSDKKLGKKAMESTKNSFYIGMYSKDVLK